MSDAMPERIWAKGITESWRWADIEMPNTTEYVRADCGDNCGDCLACQVNYHLRLVEPLRALNQEVRAILYMSDFREAIGNTNWNAIKGRLDRAMASLKRYDR